MYKQNLPASCSHRIAQWLRVAGEMGRVRKRSVLWVVIFLWLQHVGRPINFSAPNPAVRPFAQVLDGARFDVSANAGVGTTH